MLMRVIDLALKDLLQIVRDRQSAIFMVIMPILFTLFFSFIYGGIDGEEDPRLPVGIVDRDAGSALTTNLLELLETSDAIRPVLLEGKEADNAAEAVQDGDLAAALIVPLGFGEQTLTGHSPQLTVIVETSTPAGQTAHNAIQAAATRLLGAVQTAQISAETFEAQAEFESQAARQAYLDEAMAMAIEAWQQPPLTVVEQAGALDEGEDAEEWNAHGHASTGMIVQFAIFGLVTSGNVLVLERKTKALKRLLTTPISRAQVIAGHVLAMFTVVFVQEVLLVAFGQLFVGADYLREPAATLLMMVILAFWAASLGLLVGALSKSEDQVVMFAMIAMFLFSALGGAWFPLDIAGQAFATVGHLTPSAWAVDGLENVVVRGLGFESVLLPAGIVLAYALAFFALAVWRFRFE
jgi:ABC-2 type transport system permease protein